MKKKALTTQVLFMIIMLILMVGIIIFGISKLNDLESSISNQKQLEIQDKITSLIEYCDNPLNKDSTAREEFKSEKFNAICVLGENNEEYSQITEFEDIANTQDNVVLLQSRLTRNNGDYSIDTQNYQIIDSFKAISESFEKTTCWTSEDTQRINMKLQC